MEKPKARENFGTRLGFILVSAGCAIGLGNVWRFPYVTGKYGGAAFIILFLLLLCACLPALVMEYAVGRGARSSFALAFNKLEQKGSKWHHLKWLSLAGPYLLMMFYTTVAGWMLAYIFKIGSGEFNNQNTEYIAQSFGAMLSSPTENIFWMLVCCALGLLVCAGGLKNGVERITKPMMACLLLILLALIGVALSLPGAWDGVMFYITPDFTKIFGNPETDGVAGSLLIFGDAIYAAMGQAFFSLSVGIGCMGLFGSYINKNRSLLGESVRVSALNVLIAILAGFLVFPACFAFGVQPDSGPSLVFITLPSIFTEMWGGQLWGALFFVFLSFAAMSTVIAVFECIIAFTMDLCKWSRTKAVLVNGALIALLSVPCALGFNAWSGFVVPGIGDIQGIEDFLISNNILPLGSLALILFCTSKRGWGWNKFLEEANTGEGAKFPSWLRPYLRYVLPTLIFVIFVLGYLPKVQVWLGMA